MTALSSDVLAQICQGAPGVVVPGARVGPP
jgi:hypothetical protein